MASTLNGVANRIEVIVEALIPPSKSQVPYRRIDGRKLDKDRMFGFPSIGREWDFYLKENAGLAAVRAAFSMQLRLHVSGLGDRSAFEAVNDEVVLIANTINTGTGWPSGARSVAVNTAETEEADSGNILVNFACEAEIEETDGVT